MNDWIDSYFRRASAISRLTVFEHAQKIAQWNALEDDVLARNETQQQTLWARCCETKDFDAAMVICAMLPLDLTSPEMEFDS